MIKHLPDNHSNNFIKLRNSLISATGKAIGDYNMIEDGDTVLVCMSGGKDSYTMLMMLLALQDRGEGVVVGAGGGAELPGADRRDTGRVRRLGAAGDRAAARADGEGDRCSGDRVAELIRHESRRCRRDVRIHHRRLVVACVDRDRGCDVRGRAGGEGAGAAGEAGACRGEGVVVGAGGGAELPGADRRDTGRVRRLGAAGDRAAARADGEGDRCSGDRVAELIRHESRRCRRDVRIHHRRLVVPAVDRDVLSGRSRDGDW